MSKKFKIIAFTFALIMLASPTLSFAAWEGLVPCNNNAKDIVTNDGTVVKSTKCDFKAFITLINKFINFILFKLAVPIAAIMFAYAGFSMIVPGGESASARTKAKHIFTNAVIGLVIAVAAWLIVKTLLTILGYKGAWIGF